MLWKEVALRSSDIFSCTRVLVNWKEERYFVLPRLSWMKRWERKCVLANKSKGCQSNCSCWSTCSALRVKKSQGSTSHFWNLHRSRSYIEISVRNCFIFRSLGRFFLFLWKKLHWSVGGISVGVFCCCEKKLGTQIGRWQLGRSFFKVRGDPR